MVVPLCSTSLRSAGCKEFKSVVTCCDICSNAAIFGRFLATIIAAEAGHVPVVSEVHDDIGGLVGDELSDPLEVLNANSWPNLRIRQNDYFNSAAHD